MRHIGREAKNYIVYLLRNLPGLWRKLEHDFTHHDRERPVVIYVPGLAFSAHALGPEVKERLETIGAKAFIFDPGVNIRDLRETARGLEAFVEEVCRRAQVKRVYLAAHSMGGLIARWYLQRLSGSRRVNKILAVAVPWAGTLTAYLALPAKAARQMLPRSAFLRHLAREQEHLERIVSLRPRRDQIIKPKASSILPGAKNIELPVVGHVTVMQAPETWQIIKKELDLS